VLASELRSGSLLPSHLVVYERGLTLTDRPRGRPHRLSTPPRAAARVPDVRADNPALRPGRVGDGCPKPTWDTSTGAGGAGRTSDTPHRRIVEWLTPRHLSPTPTQQQIFDLSTPHTVNVSKVAVPNGRPNCLVFRLRDAVYAAPYAAWIPTMPPSQGVVLPNTPLKLSSAPPSAPIRTRLRCSVDLRARRTDPACCARPAGRARAGRPGGAVVDVTDVSGCRRHRGP
jgi:hypothetical protein